MQRVEDMHALNFNSRTAGIRAWMALPLLASLYTASLVSAEEPHSEAQTPAARSEEVLKNHAVIELKQAGFGEALIIDAIKAGKCDFDVSIAGLKELKTAGLSDPIISAIIIANAAGRNGVATQAKVTGSDDPTSPHEAGIWLVASENPKMKMTELEPSVYIQHKTGVAIFAQFGQSVKSECVIRGAHAESETTNRRPVFYFYFENTRSGLSNSNQGATSANEYVLSQFESVEKDNQRRLIMGQFNAYSGSEHGADGKSVRSFAYEKLAPGIYRVSPKEDLASGEYGFYFAGNNGGGKVFDFGVRGTPETEPSNARAEVAQKHGPNMNPSKGALSKPKPE